MNQKIYTVSQLNTEARLLLEGHFPRLWISGEISNLASPTSGHIYFSLKDQSAQVRCAMFRTQKSLLSFTPENGAQVLLQATLSLYEARGDYQLIVDYMELMGDGLLRQAFERLKAKLENEGLFREEYKQTIPRFPRIVGIITSPTGAAIQDILSALQRRFPAIRVIIYPCQVQGALAAGSIVAAIKQAEKHATADVLIIARGGGTLEDLQAFNEEKVARAVFACPIPTVSGIGHEVDVTIVDYVADRRGATPTAAAELVSPDQWELMTHLQNYRERLYRIMLSMIQEKQGLLKHAQTRLRHPQHQLIEKTQRLDYLVQAFQQAQLNRMLRYKTKLHILCVRIEKNNPKAFLQNKEATLLNLYQRLLRQMKHQIEQSRQQMLMLTRALDAVNPLSILHRGYAIVSNAKGSIIHCANDLNEGDQIMAQLSEGQLICEVKQVIHELD